MKPTLRFSAFSASLLFTFLLGLGLFNFASDIDGERSLDSGFEIEGSGEKLNELKRRDEWLYFQRAYPAEEIPAEAGIRMIEQLEREEARLEQLRAGSGAEAPDQQMVWASIGPQPVLNFPTFGTPRSSVSGRVSAVALDPRYDGVNNQTVYIGGAQGGVWKSTDNGANWTPLTDSQPSLAMGAIAVDPKNPNVIYAGTGESSSCALCYYGAGLLKSTDGGSTWTQITGPVSTIDPKVPAFLNAGFTSIAIDPVNTSVIFVGTGATAAGNRNAEPVAAPVGQVGLWKSTDGGNTWRNVDPGGTNGATRCHDIIIDPQNNNRVYAAMRATGVFVSNSGGEPGTWQRLTNGLPEPGASAASTNFRRINLAFGPGAGIAAGITLYAAYASTDGELLGIWRSTNGGGNWSQVTNPQRPGQANYNLDIAVDPTDGRLVYYGTSVNSANTGGTLFRSRNSGDSWEDISRGNGQTGGLHPDTHQIVIAPTNRNIIFTGNDGGVWRTNNATANTVPWIQLNNTLGITQFTSVALHPTNANLLIGGTQDNGTLRYQGNVSWNFVDVGDGGASLIDQSNPQVMYHTYFNVNNEDGERPVIGPAISTTGGGLNSWTFRGCLDCTAREGGFNPADRVAFYAPMALSTGFTGANGNAVYFGAHRLYRSSDRGVTWDGLGQSADNFGADLTKGQGVITAIAAHPGLNNATSPPGEVVWVGTSDGLIQVTSNAGALDNATFSNVTKSPLPNRFVSDIALDAGNRQRAVAVFSGFDSVTPSTPGHVFVTNNLGATWQNISGNLPDVPVNSVALHPTLSGTIYIGADLGVFQTTDGGATWTRLSAGMPRVAAFMVRYHNASNTLFAATHGRGVFKLTTARSATTVSAANFSASSIATEAIVATFGVGLATRVDAPISLPLPVSLSGTRVIVSDSAGADRAAPLFFVAPLQVNYQVPPGTAPGLATIIVTSGDGIISSGAVQVASVAPSLFSANSSGKDAAAGFALRVRADGSQENAPINQFDSGQNKFVPAPIDLGPSTDQVFLVLFGTGFRFRSSLTGVTATIGGVGSEVLFAGDQGGFVGLDQANIRIPRSLIGRGEVDVALTVDGKPTNILKINIK
ncbi:MAG: hypothetical protein AB7U82_08165 [Blastocatellales bacterium]